ncbi:MAG: hypothetical protein QOD51_1769 [Candidatus Eremiobacteraeota bacterium]|jgi:hypothetical protein|nr:hypothetical protein [Candidatus Eremiobacteraeota bacterium]
MVGFIIRLVGYALLLGIASRIAQTLWSNDGLDAVRALTSFHDKGVTGLLAAPLVLALIGTVPALRAVAVFLAFFLAGAALTAPFVCARVAGL